MDALLSLLSSAMAAVASFLTSWLPDDPFAGFIGNFSAFASASSTGLGWLNWFYPFGDMAGVMAMLITAVLVCAVARLVFTIIEFRQSTSVGMRACSSSRRGRVVQSRCQT